MDICERLIKIFQDIKNHGKQIDRKKLKQLYDIEFPNHEEDDVVGYFKPKKNRIIFDALMKFHKIKCTISKEQDTHRILYLVEKIENDHENNNDFVHFDLDSVSSSSILKSPLLLSIQEDNNSDNHHDNNHSENIILNDNHDNRDNHSIITISQCIQEIFISKAFFNMKFTFNYLLDYIVANYTDRLQMDKDKISLALHNKMRKSYIIIHNRGFLLHHKLFLYECYESNLTCFYIHTRNMKLPPQIESILVSEDDQSNRKLTLNKSGHKPDPKRTLKRFELYEDINDQITDKICEFIPGIHVEEQLKRKTNSNESNNNNNKKQKNNNNNDIEQLQHLFSCKKCTQLMNENTSVNKEFYMNFLLQLHNSKH